MAKVLLSAMGTPVAPGIIRGLKQQGHYVIGMDAGDYPVGQFFADAFVKAPLIRDTKAYLAFLEEQAQSCDLFFPYIDEELECLAANWYGLSGTLKSRLMISAPKTLQTTLNKRRFMEFCRENNLPYIPLRDAPPIYVKPEKGRGGCGQMILNTAEEVALYASRPDILMQEVVSGQEYTVDILTGHGGKWLFGVARKRLAAKGVSTIGQIDMAKDVLNLCRRCVEMLDFRGPINIQLFRRENGDLLLSEVNARLSGSYPITAKAGFDIAAAAVELALKGADFVFEAPAVQDQLIVWRYYEEYVPVS